MKFLADENIYEEIVEFLRKSGHDIEDLKELRKFGIADEEVLKLAIEKKRMLVTQDTDFADLRFLPRKNPGLIVIRVKPATIENITLALGDLLKRIKPTRFKNSLVILEEDKIRVRKI